MVEAALLSIPEITGVKITFSEPKSTACNPITNIISIEFLQQFGDLPPLVPLLDSTMLSTGLAVNAKKTTTSYYNLLNKCLYVGGQVLISADGKTTFADYISGQILRSQIGTKESDSCADRGICSSDGVCTCFNTNGDAYGSSDGYGNPGPRGDCG
jgi:hypothetical protein